MPFLGQPRLWPVYLDSFCFKPLECVSSNESIFFLVLITTLYKSGIIRQCNKHYNN